VTRIALLHPSNLLGRELREALDRHPELWRELILLTTHEEEVGSLTEVRGSAAMVQAYTPEAMAEVDLVLFCGPLDANRTILEALPPGTTAVVLSPDAGLETGRPLVAAVNLAEAYRGELLLSPHPAVIALAQLLHPLAQLGLESAAATVVLPVSTREQPALDELFEQTRAILAFAEKKPQSIFGRQMAFNLVPAPDNHPGSAEIAALLESVLGGGPQVSAQLLEGGIFHSVSVSLHLRFADDPGLEAVRGAYEDHPFIALEDSDDAPGPIDAANREELLLGRIARDPHAPGSYWLWAVMDNLTHGGADNAVAIVEKVLGSPAAS
jgi:aspartate-semialdehyde dehydrogenase